MSSCPYHKKHLLLQVFFILTNICFLFKQISYVLKHIHNKFFTEDWCETQKDNKKFLIGFV